MSIKELSEAVCTDLLLEVAFKYQEHNLNLKHLTLKPQINIFF